MEESQIQQYRQQVEVALAKYARTRTQDERDDLRGNCYLAIVERQAEIEADDPAAVNRICREAIAESLRKAQELQRGDSTEIVLPEFRGVRLENLEAALARLPPVESHVIRALFLEGESAEQVGKKLGHSAWWVRSTRDIALKKLKGWLE